MTHLMIQSIDITFFLQTGGEEQFPAPYMVTPDEDLFKLRIPEPIKRNDKPLDIHAVSFDQTQKSKTATINWFSQDLELREIE